MPRGPVPSRTEPKEEISTEIQKHNVPATVAKGSVWKPKASRAEQYAKDFGKAKEQLDLLNDASAVEYMSLLPQGLLEMFLLAEETGKARPLILRSFPKPGARARERYLQASALS